MKKILCLFFFLVASVCYAETRVYPTKEECEIWFTGFSCHFQVCEYAGREEGADLCKHFPSGWAPYVHYAQRQCPENGCPKNSSPIRSLSIAFPSGETRLLIQRDGPTFFFYGQSPGASKKIKSGTFEIAQIHEDLQTRTNRLMPVDKVKPGMDFGTVQILRENNAQEDYFFYDEQYALDLFEKAKKSIRGE